MYRFLNMLRVCPFSTMFLVVWYIINEHVDDLCWNINCYWNVTLSSLLMQPIQRYHISERVRHLVQMVLRLRNLPRNVVHFPPREKECQLLLYALNVRLIHHVCRGGSSHTSAGAFAPKQRHRRFEYLLLGMSWQVCHSATQRRWGLLRLQWWHETKFVLGHENLPQGFS